MSDRRRRGAPLIRIEVWNRFRAMTEASAIFAVYDAVFGDMPDEVAWVSTTYTRHAARKEFRLVVALDGEQVVGFAYGYQGERGQYWSDRVADALPAHVVDAWLGGHFEFVELGVLPEYRGRGIGRRLHDALLDGALGSRALLSTVDDEDDPAVRLYLACGWRKLGNLAEDVQVMGRQIGGDKVGP